MEEIVNKVAKSGLITLDLAELMHTGERVIFDLKDQLFQGMILREKDFRTFLKENNWSVYQGKNVGLVCSADAIVPVWAYMLLVTKLEGIAHTISFGNELEVEKILIQQAVDNYISKNDLTDQKMVIKGCSEIENKEFAYTYIAQKLVPLVSSLMYGEPCSTVPIFKKKRKR